MCPHELGHFKGEEHCIFVSWPSNDRSGCIIAPWYGAVVLLYPFHRHIYFEAPRQPIFCMVFQVRRSSKIKHSLACRLILYLKTGELGSSHDFDPNTKWEDIIQMNLGLPREHSSISFEASNTRPIYPRGYCVSSTEYTYLCSANRTY